MTVKKIFSIVAVLSVIITSVVISPAPAAVIYSSFGPNDSFNTSSFWSITGRDVQNGIAYYCASSFVPTADYFFDRAELEVVNLKQSIHINLQLMTDANGLPGTIIEETAIALDNLPLDASEYFQLASAASSAHPRLIAGQKYWLAAIPGTDTTWTAWCKNSIGRSGAAFHGEMYNPTNNAWQYSEGTTQGAFRISGTLAPVPEPSSMTALAFAGLCALPGIRMLRSRK